jgi:hypothetical protein
MAVLLPIWVVRYTSFQYCVKHGQKLTADSDQDVHLSFALSNPAFEVFSTARQDPVLSISLLIICSGVYPLLTIYSPLLRYCS